MANSDIVDLIIQLTADYFIYMLPIVGIMAGITFLVSWLYEITIGTARKSFRG